MAENCTLEKAVPNLISLYTSRDLIGQQSSSPASQIIIPSVLCLSYQQRERDLRAADQLRAYSS